MRRYIVGLLLALILLSGCGRDAKVLAQTETCTITQEGTTITVCCMETGAEYTFTSHSVRRVRGVPRPFKTLVDAEELFVQSCDGVLYVEDRAAGITYIIE